jgi:hypothetical protein
MLGENGREYKSHDQGLKTLASFYLPADQAKPASRNAAIALEEETL